MHGSLMHSGTTTLSLTIRSGDLLIPNQPLTRLQARGLL